MNNEVIKLSDHRKRTPVRGFGSAEEIAAVVLDDDTSACGARPRTDERGVYHVWHDGLWRERRELQVVGSVWRIQLGNEQKQRKAFRTVLSSSASPGFFRDDSISLSGTVLRVTPDGIAVSTPRPEYGTRHAFGVEYDPDWVMPEDSLLAHYMRTTFDNDADRAAASELMGAVLFGLGGRGKAWVLANASRDVWCNGKTTLLDLLGGLAWRQALMMNHQFRDRIYRGWLLGSTFCRGIYETRLLRNQYFRRAVLGEPLEGSISGALTGRRVLEFRSNALLVFDTSYQVEPSELVSVLLFGGFFRDNPIRDLSKRILREELGDLVHLAIEGARRLAGSSQAPAS